MSWGQVTFRAKRGKKPVCKFFSGKVWLFLRSHGPQDDPGRNTAHSTCSLSVGCSLPVKKSNLEPLAGAAVMMADIGRGVVKLIRVISFSSFLCQVSFAMLAKRLTGERVEGICDVGWSGWGRCKFVTAISIRAWWMRLTGVPLRQNLHSQQHNFLPVPSFLFLILIRW